MQRSVRPENLTVTNHIAQILSHSNNENVQVSLAIRGGYVPGKISNRE
jgi:hypothetical protein